MRKFLIAAALVAVVAPANANLVLNGGFENITGFTGSSEFDSNGAGYATRLVDNWTNTDKTGFNISFDSATASTVSADNRFNDPLNQLSALYTGPSPDGGRFVALDGDNQFDSPLEQTIGGLTIGQSYALTFYWASTQLQNRTGPTTEQLQVSFGGQTALTGINAIPTQGFVDWKLETFSFTATSVSQILSFLSLGTPNGLPPIALLDGVSLVETPAPAAMALFGLGVIALGAARRRG